MHEQSETVQDPITKKWINVYGRGTKKAGQKLPGTREYGTVEEAVRAARERSAATILSPRKKATATDRLMEE